MPVRSNRVRDRRSGSIPTQDLAISVPVQLPPVLGTVEREPVFILVTGRTAMARMAGLPSVARQVATVNRIGMEAVVLYPPRMRTLGAEIRGQIADDARVLSYDDVTAEAGESVTGTAEPMVTALAADWYLSFRAIADFCRNGGGRAAMRFEDRGRLVAPIVRLPFSRLRSLLPQLEDRPAGAVLSGAAGPDAELFRCDVKSRHRLSDNIAIGRAEAKLFSALQRPGQSPFVQVLHKYLSLGIVPRLARAGFRPVTVSLLKLFLGAAAASMLASSRFTSLLFGALLLCLLRAFDGGASEIARARIETRTVVEKIDFAGDVLVFVFAVVALSARPDVGPRAGILAVITVLGILASAATAYAMVMRERWHRLDRSGYMVTPARDFASRFTNRGGAAYGLVLAVLIGRLDLFLWAAALASHLFYLVLLRLRGRQAASAKLGTP